MEEMEEIVDIVTPLGVFEGKSMRKSKAHAGGWLHMAVNGFITDGRGRVLCQQRGPDCSMMRNVWDVIGAAGHISAHRGPRPRPDNYVQAVHTLQRELAEELGVDIDIDFFSGPDSWFLGTTITEMIVEGGWLHWTLDFNILLRLPNLDPAQCRLEPGKVLAVEWRHVGDIEAAMQASPRSYAVRAPNNDWLIGTAFDAVRRAALR